MAVNSPPFLYLMKSKNGYGCE